MHRFEKLHFQKKIFKMGVTSKVYRSTKYVFIFICYDRFEKEVNPKPWRIDLEIKSYLGNKVA